MDGVERLRKMITDLNVLLIDLEKLHELRDHHAKSVGKDSDETNKYESAENTIKHIEKDLLKIWSQIRGYNHEASIAMKQYLKGNVVMNIPGEKQGDILAAALKKTGVVKNKVFQAKSYSGAETDKAANHIIKACAQLFGSNPKEVPGPSSDLIADIDIHSSKCFWPYTQSSHAKPKGGFVKLSVFKKYAADQLKDYLERGLKEAASKWPTHGSAYYRAIEKAGGLQPGQTEASVQGQYVQTVASNIASSEIQIRINYKNPVAGNVVGYTEKHLFRTTDADLKYLKVKAKVDPNTNTVQIISTTHK